MTALLRRVRDEVFTIIAPEYGTEPDRVTYDTEDGTWICVKNLPVPPRLTRTGSGEVDILLLVPPSYPQLPPDGFYCDQNLNIHDHYMLGWRDKYFPALQGKLVEQGWQWFCAHAYTPMNAMAWRPSSIPLRGDNLMSYLHLCLGILGKEGSKLR